MLGIGKELLLALLWFTKEGGPTSLGLMSNLLASIPKIPSAHYGIKSNRAFSSQQQLRQSTIHPHILLARVYFFVALNSEMQSILIHTRYLTSFYLELICFVKETRNLKG